MPDDPDVEDGLDVSDIGVDSILEAAGLATPPPPTAQEEQRPRGADTSEYDEISDLGFDDTLGVGEFPSEFDDDVADTDPAGLTGVDDAFFSDEDEALELASSDDDWVRRPSPGLKDGFDITPPDRSAFQRTTTPRSRLAVHVASEVTGASQAVIAPPPERRGGFVADWLANSGSTSAVADAAGVFPDFADERLTRLPSDASVPDDFARVALSDEEPTGDWPESSGAPVVSYLDSPAEFDLELPDGASELDTESDSAPGVDGSGIMRRQGTAAGGSPSGIAQRRGTSPGETAAGLAQRRTPSTQRPVELRGRIGSSGFGSGAGDGIGNGDSSGSTGQVIARTRVRQRMVRKSDIATPPPTGDTPAPPEPTDESVD